MSETPIRNVADTAFWVATYRANETVRSDALFRDPLAERLVEGRGRDIASKMDDSEIVAWVVVIRTCIIDEFIRAAIARGTDTIVNLGAGLDTRPYRMDLPPSLKWIEVDFPSTIAFKEERLKDETSRCSLERVELDLGDDAARKRLFDRINANAKSVFVLTEGVIPYLSNDQVESLARALHAQSHFDAWMLEYTSPDLMKMSRRFTHRRQLKNAPFKFKPDDWNAFFAQQGFKLKEMRYLVEEGRRRGRFPPLSLKMRLAMMFFSRAKRHQLGKMRGYALLEKVSSEKNTV